MGRAGVARELVDPGRLLGREVGGAKNLALTEDRPDDAHDPPPSLFISAAAARSFVTMASGEVSPGRRAHSLTISASLASSVLRKSATVSTPAARSVLPRDLPTCGSFSTGDRRSTRLNSSHKSATCMPPSA